jgi:hypothetical protein
LRKEVITGFLLTLILVVLLGGAFYFFILAPEGPPTPEETPAPSPPTPTPDPSIVGTSTTASATEEPTQRKAFFANERYWVFYSDGTNFVYSSSIDGETWDTPTTIRPATAGYRCSIFFNGTYVYYAVSQPTLGTALVFRQGAPNSTGGITWLADEQIAVAGETGIMYRDPMIAVDSEGYALIGYKRYNNTDGTTYPWITKSGDNNGTWGRTPSPFPYQLNSTYSAASWNYAIAPLTDRKFYVTYGHSKARMYGRLYDGTNMGDMETVTSSKVGQTWSHSTVNQGDHVHMVFKKAFTHELIYINRTYGSGWGSEEEIQSATATDVSPVLSIDKSTNDLYCFWSNNNRIYYKKRSGSLWDPSATDWIDESLESLTGVGKNTCFYKSYEGKIGFVYMTGTSSPYRVKFEYIDVDSSADEGTHGNFTAQKYGPSRFLGTQSKISYATYLKHRFLSKAIGSAMLPYEVRGIAHYLLDRKRRFPVTPKTSQASS